MMMKFGKYSKIMTIYKLLATKSSTFIILYSVQIKYTKSSRPVHELMISGLITVQIATRIKG